MKQDQIPYGPASYYAASTAHGMATHGKRLAESHIAQGAAEGAVLITASEFRGVASAY